MDSICVMSKRCVQPEKVKLGRTVGTAEMLSHEGQRRRRTHQPPASQRSHLSLARGAHGQDFAFANVISPTFQLIPVHVVDQA